MAQFQNGNRAALGNRGGGRPTGMLREIASKSASRIWSELEAIAFDQHHPLHTRHAFDALKLLATLTFPRPQSLAVEGATGATPNDGEFGILQLAEAASAAVKARLARAETLASSESPPTL